MLSTEIELYLHLQIKALLINMFGARKICDKVNPDEVVSYGAAVQASILSGASDKLLVDVTNFSLGTNTKGDIMVSTGAPHPASPPPLHPDLNCSSSAKGTVTLQCRGRLCDLGYYLRS